MGQEKPWCAEQHISYSEGQFRQQLSKHLDTAPTQVRDAREFYNAYGDAVERCFTECVTNFNKRSLSSEEHVCITSCGLKRMATRQISLGTWQDVMPKVMERSMKEQQAKAEEHMKKQEELALLAPQRVAAPPENIDMSKLK